MIARRYHPRGFTLLEMLVALAIFAAMGTLAYLTLNQALLLRDRINAERDHWRGLAIAFSRIEDDFSQVRARSARDYSGTLTAALTGSSGGEARDDEAIVEFTRGGADVSDETRRSDLQRIAYAVKGNALLRLNWSSSDPVPGSKPATTRMLEQVRQIRVQYMSADRAWLDQWPPRNAPAVSLPFGIKVSLEIRDRGEYTRIFVLHD